MATLPLPPLVYTDKFLIKDVADEADNVLPTRQALQFVGTGVSLEDDPVNGVTIVTITSEGLADESASYPGGVTLAAGERAWVDGTGGLVPIVAPAVGAGVKFAICDGKKGGSFSGTTHGVTMANGTHVIEDPNNPGVYTTDPILMTLPSQSAIWQGDPTGTFFKLVGG